MVNICTKKLRKRPKTTSYVSFNIINKNQIYSIYLTVIIYIIHIVSRPNNLDTLPMHQSSNITDPSMPTQRVGAPRWAIDD